MNITDYDEMDRLIQEAVGQPEALAAGFADRVAMKMQVHHNRVQNRRLYALGCIYLLLAFAGVWGLVCLISTEMAHRLLGALVANKYVFGFGLLFFGAGIIADRPRVRQIPTHNY